MKYRTETYRAQMLFTWTYAVVWAIAVAVVGFWGFAPAWLRVLIACGLGLVGPPVDELFLSKSDFETRDRERREFQASLERPGFDRTDDPPDVAD